MNVVASVPNLAIGLLRHLGYDLRMLALTAAPGSLVGVVVYKTLPKQNPKRCAAAGEAAGNLS
jgi:hypothetical protein